MPPVINRNSRGRHWLLTYNNPVKTAEELIIFFNEKSWKYVFQKERGVAGTEHFQIYIRTERVTMRELVNAFVTYGIHPHIELARRWKQAMLYCCKEESRISPQFYTNIPEEITPPVVPKLVICKRKLDAGATVSSLADDEATFSTWVAHNRSLNTYKCMKMEPRMMKTICVYFYGQPGCGKSRLALDLCKYMYPDEIPFYKTKGIWWDLYNYEKAVIWDDFRGDCYEPQELFKLCDRYPYKVQVKGSFLNFKSDLVVFTSNICPMALYKDGKAEPLLRRLEVNWCVYNYNGEGISYCNPDPIYNR